MKRLVTTFLFVLVIALAVSAFTSCEIPFLNQECEHSGGAATCTEQAICEKCNTPYGEVPGHVWDNDCDTECNDCSETREIEHDWVAGTPVNATCTTDGYTPYTCSICAATENRDVQVGAHNWVAGTPVEATCTEDGYTPYTCSGCSATENRNVVLAGHVWDDADAAIKNCTECGLHVNPDFAGGKGTEDDPYLIATADQLTNISNYYETYKFYKVADGVTELDLAGIGRINLNGSFDGNGVKLVNLETALFYRVGYQNEAADIVISNIEATMNATDGCAFVRNIFNAGTTTFENITLNGYIEGLYNMGSFYNYGTANCDGVGADYTVKFVNAKSDVDIVCTSGNTAGGFLGHSFEGAGKSFTLYVDADSAYTGTIYTVGAKPLGNLYFAMTSDYNNANNHFYINGEEVKFDNGHIPACENRELISKVDPTLGSDGYYASAVDGATKFVVYINAQVTAYDADGNMIPNLNGMTWSLGTVDITENLDGKLFDLVTSAVIVNDTDDAQNNFGYTVEDGVLTIYSGRTTNYCEGKVRLQVNQYDNDGNLLATGTIEVFSIARVTA